MATLYELSADPAIAIAEIRDHYGRPESDDDTRDIRQRLFDEATKILSEDDYVEASVSEAAIGAFEALGAGDVDVKGPLGLFVALDAATYVTRSDASTSEARRLADEAFDRSKRVLEDPETIACFRELYGIHETVNLEKARLHKIGTTSLILRCLYKEVGQVQPVVVALKCLLPRYHGVQAITKRTHAYEEEHAYKEDLLAEDIGVPYVYDSTPLTIMMEFIAGDTLAERLATRVAPYGVDKAAKEARALDADDIGFIRNVGLAVCRRLAKLAERGHHHLDLSPSNIIVTKESPDEVEVTLIDFGRNYVITERVGTSAAFRRAALYVAPELVESPSMDGWRCDVYSLGLILLEAAAKRTITQEDLAGELDRLWEGDDPWDGAPGLARIIEELIDHDPEQRLALIPPDEGEKPYEYLQKLIRQETEVLAHYEKRTSARGFGVLRIHDLLWLYRNAQVLNLKETLKTVAEPVDDTYRDFPALAKWARVAILCWVVTLGSFATLTLADRHIAALTPFITEVAHDVGAPVHVGRFWENLSGRLVALTFGITAVTYYINNFAMLSPRRLNGRIGWLSELTMRATPIGLAIPILWAMLYDPNAWPLCSGFGTLLVVANNFIALRIAVRAYEVGARFSTRTKAGDRFIREVFKEWWLLMGGYSLALILIGFLFIADGAPSSEKELFAYLVVVINLAKMYRLNCVELAPQVRGCLSRDLLTIRRAMRLDARGIAATARAQWYVGRFPGARRRLQDWWWAPLSRRVATEPGGGVPANDSTAT